MPPRQVRKASGLGCVVILTAVAMGGFAEAGALPELYETVFKRPVRHVSAKGARDIAGHFRAHGYRLDLVRKNRSAPRIFVQRIPPDLAALPTHQKARTFIGLMLPAVIKANGKILSARRALLALKKKRDAGDALTAAERRWLASLAHAYAGDARDMTELARRVDIIPSALAIAQSIDESAWGTSRFAIEGNALFGEHLPAHSKGKFVLAHGAKIKVAAFDTVLAGVEGYMRNLNTSRAYRDLRRRRAAARAKGARPSGFDMALGLRNYSARGVGYVETLRDLMRWHKLSSYDGVAFSPKGGAVLVSP